jgi:hypothetical protein
LLEEDDTLFGVIASKLTKANGVEESKQEVTL